MHIVKRLLVPGFIALGAVLSVLPLSAAESHGHGVPTQLQLDHDKKWPTDEALRRGMEEMRTAMAAALGAIHRNSYSDAQYKALAQRLQTQIDYVVGNCKLPEKADAQLHIVLEQIIDGIAVISSGSGQAKGAAAVMVALNQYGRYFDHAGWRPLVE